MMGSKEATPVEDRVAAVTASGRKVCNGSMISDTRLGLLHQPDRGIR